MTNTNSQLLILILIAAFVTVLTRSAAFFIFKKGRTPAFITWLGSQLPGAVMAMLLVYCLKDISFTAPSGFIPALLGVAVTSGVHVFKKNMMLSIISGTAVYMLLLRLLA